MDVQYDSCKMFGGGSKFIWTLFPGHGCICGNQPSLWKSNHAIVPWGKRLALSTGQRPSIGTKIYTHSHTTQRRCFANISAVLRCRSTIAWLVTLHISCTHIMYIYIYKYSYIISFTCPDRYSTCTYFMWHWGVHPNAKKVLLFFDVVTTVLFGNSTSKPYKNSR